MEELMEEFKRFYDTHSEIDYLFTMEANKKEYDDRDKRNANGERFVCRNHLSDFYSQLTEEQKKFIAKYQVILGYALIEDRHDNEYNIKNYYEMNKNFSTKGGVIWKS
jgi:hypothetical protein